MANFRSPFLSTINAFRKLLLFTFKTEVSIHVGLQNKKYNTTGWNGMVLWLESMLLFFIEFDLSILFWRRKFADI